MRYLFLIKAGKKYGLGHYARSKSLAIFLKGEGHEVTFWVEGDSIDLQEEFNVIEKRVEEEPSFLIKFIHETNIDVLYTDGIFEFDKELINNLRSKIPVIFYQNLSASKAYCDVFISPYPYDSRINSVRKSGDVKLYEGFKFYIIRDEVRELNRNLSIKKDIKRFVITTGGSDPNFILEKICEMIDFESHSSLCFTALIGSSFDSERIKKLKTAYKFPNLTFVSFSLKEVAGADFIISTLGVSVFEFLYLGKLVASTSTDQNADKIGQYLGKEHLIINLGLYKQIDQRRINNLLDQINKKPKSFINMADKAKKVIDGNGLKRVSKILENL